MKKKNISKELVEAFEAMYEFSKGNGVARHSKYGIGTIMEHNKKRREELADSLILKTTYGNKAQEIKGGFIN